jgi:hypothetical protein
MIKLGLQVAKVLFQCFDAFLKRVVPMVSPMQPSGSNYLNTVPVRIT